MTAIHLEGSCPGDIACGPLAKSTFEKLSTGRYVFPCSVLLLPPNLSLYMADHRTARKRTAHATRLGYRFQPVDRTRYEQDVFDINTSAPERQGRPMTAGYTAPVKFSPLPHYRCARHAINTYGVLDGHDRLRAYTWVYRVGELVMFSQILGHADHLAHDVMYLLVTGALDTEIRNGPGYGFYNMHDSGTEGLRFFKERLGFKPTRVKWVP